jgi:hypothetical protein
MKTILRVIDTTFLLSLVVPLSWGGQVAAL